MCIHTHTSFSLFLVLSLSFSLSMRMCGHRYLSMPRILTSDTHTQRVEDGYEAGAASEPSYGYNCNYFFILFLSIYMHSATRTAMRLAQPLSLLTATV